MVQDLYQMAFCRQLEFHAAGSRQDDPTCLSDEALADLLYDYAELLEQIDHISDAELLVSIADETVADLLPRSA